MESLTTAGAAWIKSYPGVAARAFDIWLTRGEWPTPEQLQRDLDRADRSRRVNVLDAYAHLPRIHQGQTPLYPQHIALPLTVIQHLDAAKPLVDLCLVVAQLAVEAYFDHEDVTQIRDSDDPLRSRAGERVDLLPRAMQLLADNPPAPVAGGSFGEVTILNINQPAAANFDGVTTIDEYIGRQVALVEADRQALVGRASSILDQSWQLTTAIVGNTEEAENPMPSADDSAAQAKKVFVVHGRNEAARTAMFTFLRAIGLSPIEWSEAITLTRKASPYIGEVLDRALQEAQAIVVLMTPDEVAYLRDEYKSKPDDPEALPQAQARPNVLFEAGMAMGHAPDRTVLVELGEMRGFSDVAGRHAVRMDGSPAKRKDLAQRLRTAGCDVNLEGSDWLTEGDLTPPPAPGGGLPLGKRMPAGQPAQGVRLDARYHDRSNGGRLEIINHGPNDILDLDMELPENLRGFFVTDHGLPIERLPAGKSHSVVCGRAMGSPAHFNLVLTGHTDDQQQVRQTIFVSLGG